MKSSNDGPLSRVEANEGFVGAEAEATVASERMAILWDWWRNSCESEVEIVKVILIPLKNHTGDAAGTRPATKESPDLGGRIGDDGVVCRGRFDSKTKQAFT